MHTDSTIQPRDAEPKLIGEVLSEGPKTLAQYIAETNDKVRRDPENWFPLGVCKHCNTNLGPNDDDKAFQVLPGTFLPLVCCRACSDKAKDQWEVEAKEARESRFRGIIPTEFVTWDDSVGNNKAKALAFRSFSFTSRKGLVIHGDSGSCKTRIAWQIVRLIVEENEKAGADRQFTWLFCDAFELATKGIPAEADRVDFLFIDDLGNEPTTTKFETSLLHLIRKRCDWHRPIFITTQQTARTMKERYFSGTAASAIIRRFRDRTIPVDTAALTSPATTPAHSAPVPAAA